MNSYIILLNDPNYLSDFKNYLKINNIPLKFSSDDSLIFIVETTSKNIAFINSLNYVDIVTKDFRFSLPDPIDDFKRVKDYGKNRSLNCTKSSTPSYKNWGLNAISAPCLWNKNITGAKVNVAVLDSGISKHSDFTVKASVSFVENETPEDKDGHGTFVAGIIAGKNPNINSFGVSYDCNLFSVKILDNNGSGHLISLIEGIIWCGDNNIQVANMSIGFNVALDTLSITLLESAINYSNNKGCIFVAASGNESSDTLDYPAAISSVISVGAINSSYEKEEFSNYGPGLDYVAPGSNIFSTYLNNSYALASGTSMSAPHVTGLIALLLSEDPLRTQEDIKSILNKHSIDLGDAGYDLKYGNGLVNIP
ncbi:MAG: S8 family serine peptidase, partial [Clostridium perfringens]|nr:S8 family serine peptidase [Clostridium perfringens]